MNARDENRDVFEKLIAVDDFLTFKKLMIKRNVELELEVVSAMKNAGQTLQAPGSEEDAAEQYQRRMLAAQQAIASGDAVAPYGCRSGMSTGIVEVDRSRCVIVGLDLSDNGLFQWL